MPSNQLVFLRQTLYQLKHEYGSRADVYFEAEGELDTKTGNRNVTRQKWCVRRAICLPTMTSAASLFPFGLERLRKHDAAVQMGDKTVVIDRRDLPQDLRIETHNWSIVIDRRRYEVLTVEEWECRAAYQIVVKELKGARVYEQVEISVGDEVEADGES